MQKIKLPSMQNMRMIFLICTSVLVLLGVISLEPTLSVDENSLNDERPQLSLKPAPAIDPVTTGAAAAIVKDATGPSNKKFRPINQPDNHNALGEMHRLMSEIDTVLDEIERLEENQNSFDQSHHKDRDNQIIPAFDEPKSQKLTTEQKTRAGNAFLSREKKTLIEKINEKMQNAVKQNSSRMREQVVQLREKRADIIHDRLKPLAGQANSLEDGLTALARKMGYANSENLDLKSVTTKTSSAINGLSSTWSARFSPPRPTLPSAQKGTLIAAINAGDIIALSLPGEESLTADFEVSRDGTIVLPEVGLMTISDLTLEQASKAIQTRLAKVYKNLDRLSVEIKERKLIINVLGFVKNPGEVLLPAGSNVQTAISQAGGLAVGAQLDRMQVRRANKVFTFNYKNYLNSGDLGILPPLEPLDTIFVPASPLTGAVEIPFSAETLTSQGDGGDDGSGIRIFGEVRTPTTMAFKSRLTLIDAIMRAGGLTVNASVENIRVVTKEGVTLINLKDIIDEGRLFDLQPLMRGTTIFVPKQDKELKIGGNVIYVMGEVVKPGAFETHGETNFIDILANAGGPTRYGETRQIRVIRKGNSRIEMVDLPAFTEGKLNQLPRLFPGDTIFVPEKADNTAPSWLKIPSERAVQVLGAMQSPGRYEWSNDMSFFDLIAAAGGPSKDADLSKIKILKKQDNGLVQATLFNLSDFVDNGGKSADLPQIRAGYVIVVPSNEGETAGSNSTIKVLGEVQTPGNVEFRTGQTLIDVLLQTGGVTSDASVDRIRVLTGGEPVYVDLQAYLDSGDATLLPDLKPGATIFVPRAIEGQFGRSHQSVFVMGEVIKPGGYEVQGEIGFIDIVANAGGPSRFADTKAIRIIRADGVVINVDLPAFTEGRSGILPRVYPGDTVFFPRSTNDPNRPSWLKIAPERAVEVLGAVARPDRYEWSNEMTFFDLIAQAGGPSREADISRIQILTHKDGVATTQIFDMQNYIEYGGDEADVPIITAGSTVNIPYIEADNEEHSWTDLSPDRAVEVIGAVSRPDRYAWSEEMTIFDLIAEAGGPVREADLSQIRILERDNERTRAKTFNMERFINSGGSNATLPIIRGGYVINIPFRAEDPVGNKSQWLDQPAERSIYLFGQVGAPGRYAFSDDLSFIDIISAADGPTNAADLRNIRVSHRNGNAAQITKVNLALYFETGDDALLPKVVPGDVIYLPSRDREWLDVSKEQTVRVLGSVGSPGRYRFEDNMTILDLLAEAGGPTNAALQKKIVIVNFSKSRDQARSFNLVKFAKTGDASTLPIVRAGDTVYVPDRSQTIWNKIQSGVSGTSGLLTFALALIAL